MQEKITELLNEKNIKELKATLSSMKAADIADCLDNRPSEDTVLLFRLLPKELAAETFTYVDSDTQQALINMFTDEETENIINKIFADDATDLVEEMPAGVVKKILKNASPKRRNAINELLNYPSESAGSIMTIEFVNFRPNMSVEEAFAIIRKTGVHKETIYTCYVIDEKRKLLGTVSVKDLLLSDYSAKISDIMDSNTISVNTGDDREFVVKQMSKYDIMAIPVTDNEQKLVGIITVDDAMDVFVEEREEDFAKMSAMVPNEESYFKTSTFTHAKNRLVWLLFLMLSATLTGVIISRYEAAIASVPILVSFIPMLMDTGGNCGSQSSTLIIRGLALDEITPSDAFKVLFKEAGIAMLVGAVLSLINGLRIYFMYRGKEDINSFSLALTVSLTIFLIVFLSEAIGCLLPIIAKKLKMDPALMAAPLITTIIDTVAIVIFFNIALAILPV